MKIRKPSVTIVLAAMLALPAAAQVGADGETKFTAAVQAGRSAATQEMSKSKDFGKRPQQAASQTGRTIYGGTIDIGGTPREICVYISSETAAIYMNGAEGQVLQCGSRIYYSGKYMPTCDGLYLSWINRTGKDFTSGDIFSSLEGRGSAANQPLGTYRMEPVSSCWVD